MSMANRDLPDFSALKLGHIRQIPSIHCNMYVVHAITRTPWRNSLFPIIEYSGTCL